MKLPYSAPTYAGHRPTIKYQFQESENGSWSVYGDDVKISPAYKTQIEALRWLHDHEKLSLEMQRSHIAGMRR